MFLSCGSHFSARRKCNVSEKHVGRAKNRDHARANLFGLGLAKAKRNRGTVIQSRGRVRWTRDRRIACLPGWSGSRVSTAAITAPPRLSPFLDLNHHLLLDFRSCYQRRLAQPTTRLIHVCERSAICADRG